MLTPTRARLRMRTMERLRQALLPPKIRGMAGRGRGGADDIVRRATDRRGKAALAGAASNPGFVDLTRRGRQLSLPHDKRAGAAGGNRRIRWTNRTKP